LEQLVDNFERAGRSAALASAAAASGDKVSSSFNVVDATSSLRLWFFIVHER
jgi:hypothetical protein